MEEPGQSLDSGWELARDEELRGDALFFAGKPGAAPHYHSAQRALFPLGTVFTSAEENDRRMEAFRRLAGKLYAVGPDGQSRLGHHAEPHPGFRLPPKHLGDTEFGRLYTASDHWTLYRLGDLWNEAAVALAPEYPASARRACRWSLHFFELYNRAWNAHLRASRWDSDGAVEMMEVERFDRDLAARGAGATPPDWIASLVDGDWMGAAKALCTTELGTSLGPVEVLLREASQAVRLARGEEALG